MQPLDRKTALSILSSDQPHTLELLAQARILREARFGRTVILHVLSNAKSGRCSEDCGFCSQSARYETGIPEYGIVSADELMQQADQAAAAGASKFCIVTATRAATPALCDQLCPAIAAIHQRHPALRICTSLGFLADREAIRLREAGVRRYNHNLETSEAFFPSLVTTHQWSDRVETVRTAKRNGLEACCGGIVGMGESDSDVVELLFALRELGVDSAPINLFNPRPGTPLVHARPIEPMKALRILALARLVLPETDIRAAGGREAVLGTLQPLALFAANSIFTNGYLTTPGQGLAHDMQMIREVGYAPEVEPEV